MAESDEKFLESVSYRIYHEIPPLTNEECRRLYLMATGSEIPRKQKRCPTCNAVGCRECRGSGYR